MTIQTVSSASKLYIHIMVPEQLFVINTGVGAGKFLAP
jgi:hypothetical protein